MRAMRVVRCTVLGAVGFGFGGAIAASFEIDPIVPSLHALLLFLLGLLIIGALGGASLGLDQRDRRKVALLALGGAVGFGFGFLIALIGLIIALLLGGPYIHWPASFYVEYGLFGASTGAVGGAVLGIALRNRRSILVLALVGFIGFGMGDMLGLPGFIEVFQGLLAGERYNPGLSAAAEAIGGASLGTALGFLEYRKLVEGHRPRVT